MNVNEERKIICREIFQMLSDDFLLKEVKDGIWEEFCGDDEGFEDFAEWWSLASKGEQKAFVHRLVGDGRDWRGACCEAEGARCTRARCDGDLGEAYENFGRYFARKYGVDKCLKDSVDGFDYGKFGSLQEDLHRGRAVASAVVGEWLIFDDETEHCIS